MPAMGWTTFIIAAIFVIAAGIAIGRISGELGERLGLGRAWAGAVLLSFATTLPELVTTFTVSLRGAYGLALGGILGSVIFNLFILVFVDIVDPDPLYNKLSKNHLATGLLGSALLGILMTGLSLGLAHKHTLISTHPGVMLAAPLAMIGLYGIGQVVLFRMAKQTFEKVMEIPTVFSKLPFWMLIVLYLSTAVIIVFAAHALGLSAERLSIRYGLAATFAGATLLGIVTSLPEITNAIACSRQRAYDLAVGNILGANSLVLVVLAVTSLMVANRLFISVSVEDAVSTLVMAGLAVLMQAVALGALAVESGHRVRRISIASLILTALYAVSLSLSYQFGK
ncbi:MAG: hypothetical protein KCHDKBKB_03087 [Elusimicrobia bacterium]|nr:hypothetical protein [Elusimicrobiota bacterium]